MQTASPISVRHSLGARLARAKRFVDTSVLYRGDTAEHTASIAEDARRQTVRVVRPLLRVAFVLVLLWVPIDLLLYGEQPRVLTTFAQWRTVMAVYCVLYDVTIDRGGFFKRRFVFWGTFLGGGLAAAVAALLGSLGSAAEPWFGSLYLIPTMTVPFLVPLPQRAIATSLIVSSAFLAFFLAQPLGAQNQGLGTIVGLTVFATGVAIAAGHAIYSLFRLNLLQAEELARHADELQQMADGLSDQVAHRTAELSTLASHVEQLRETDRRTFARDLHDELGQLLTGLQLGLGVLRRRAEQGGDVGEELDRLHVMLDATTDSMRSITAHLRPKILDDFGIVAALEWMVADLGTRSEVRLSFSSNVDDIELPPEVATALFRIAQEATTNALRHANARTIALELCVDSETVVVSVRDDGAGIPPPTHRRSLSMGLVGMRERALALSGSLQIVSPAAGGAQITASIPWAASHVEHRSDPDLEEP